MYFITIVSVENIQKSYTVEIMNCQVAINNTDTVGDTIGKKNLDVE